MLAAVDAAVMLVDAAKGLEAQTFKLSEVCPGDFRGVLDRTSHSDGVLLALFSERWRLANVQRDHPEVLLDSLVADVTARFDPPAN